MRDLPWYCTLGWILKLKVTSVLWIKPKRYCSIQQKLRNIWEPRSREPSSTVTIHQDRLSRHNKWTFGKRFLFFHFKCAQQNISRDSSQTPEILCCSLYNRTAFSCFLPPPAPLGNTPWIVIQTAAVTMWPSPRCCQRRPSCDFSIVEKKKHFSPAEACVVSSAILPTFPTGFTG